MDKQMMMKLEEQFCKVIKDITNTGFKSANDVNTAKSAVSGLVKIKALEAMENSSWNDEGSYMRGRSHDMASRDGRSYDDRSYDEGSYRRSYDGYDYNRSGHDDIRQNLERMLKENTSQENRKAIRTVLDMI